MRKKPLNSRIAILAAAVLALAPMAMLTGCGSSDDPVPTYSVGATVSGLPANYSVVLQNNGDDDLTVTADGTNNFSKAAANGASYHVTVKTQPNSAANTLCVASNPAGTVSGGAVTVTVQCVPTVTVIGHVEDDSTNTYLAATIEARNPADDSVIATTTCDSSTTGTNYSIQAPNGLDFYLHANGGDIGGTTYVADNLQIQNETSASAVVFYMVDTTNVNIVASAMGFDIATAAVFSGDVEDSSSTGIAGVNIDTIPAVTKLLYNKDGSNFDDTPPQTTTYNGSSFIGWVNGLSGAATYTFTLDPAQTSGGSYDYTIPTTFKLRLHPGEISDVSAVSYP